MNIYSISRKIADGLLGVVWGYRANLAMGRGITLGDCLIFLIPIIFLQSFLIWAISKEKQTSDIKIINKEIYKDVGWIIFFIVLGYFITVGFDLIFK